MLPDPCHLPVIEVLYTHVKSHSFGLRWSGQDVLDSGVLFGSTQQHAPEAVPAQTMRSHHHISLLLELVVRSHWSRSGMPPCAPLPGPMFCFIVCFADGGGGGIDLLRANSWSCIGFGGRGDSNRVAHLN